MPEVLATGIDISEFNGDVDIAAMTNKIDFAIIRCGFGGDRADQDDWQFENNVKKCDDAGVPYGVYLYSYAKDEAGAKSEAAHTLRLLKGRKPLYGVWYDVEDKTLPTGEKLIDNCITYCSAIEDAGYYCGIYASASWFETRLKSPRLDRFDKWVAQWSSTLRLTKGVGMWQYTDKGVINGKQFDMDRAFRDYPQIIQGMEENELTKEEITALARKEAQKVYTENEEKYKTIDNVPRWARTAVENVYDELKLAGNSATTDDGDLRLDASLSYVRALYVINRLLERLDHMMEANSKMLDAAEAIRLEMNK